MLIYSPPSTPQSIPLIDLSDSFSNDLEKRKSVAWEIHKACRTTGFFYIKNHGIPPELLEKQLEISKKFFDLPIDEKLAIDFKNSSCMRGYEQMGIQTLDEGSPPDLKEGFMSGKNLDDNHPYVQKGYPQHGQNQWPEKAVDFRLQTEAYMQHTLQLGKHLAGLLALSLGLDENYFEKGYEEAVIITRLLHYPPQSEKIINNQIGCGAHTDWGLLTILLQDEVGGLEVRNSNDEWIRAPHIADTFIVNLGDLVQFMTNGLYRSTMHRVFNSKAGVSRYSVPTFFDLDYEYKIKKLENLGDQFKSESNEMTVGEYLAYMYQKTYAPQTEAV